MAAVNPLSCSAIFLLQKAKQQQKNFRQFDLAWGDSRITTGVTEEVLENIARLYKENSSASIYYFMLLQIFDKLNETIDESVLPKEGVGYQDSEICQKLYNYQKDTIVAIISKLEKYNGCILADSVGLGKTFTVLGVIKYYELLNRKASVLRPKKMVANWVNYIKTTVPTSF